MNRTQNINKIYEEIRNNDCYNNINSNYAVIDNNGSKIVKDELNGLFYIDLFIKNIVRNLTDKIEYSENEGKNGILIEKCITIDDNNIDYKDIILDSWNIYECIRSNISTILINSLKVKPIVITDKLLRLANVYQYENYISGRKGYDNIPMKYMTVDMAKIIILNNGNQKLPRDIKKEAENRIYNENKRGK